ncbi:MAG TPA: hypothetical protein P5165_04800 [Spirochaetia bacterium]|nr:hypothetical protein [Spirochaetales bacterium]HRY72525.1 hypothetical protein [Spirochaetia bacterium]
MKRTATLAALVLALAMAASPLFAQAPVVSEKKDVAVFALGYYGWAIPFETLGNIDMEIQKVFVDLGRFNIIGVTQRLSSGGLEQFIATLKKAKEASFVMPEKYQFGEAILTEGEFNKLVGAFIVAAPVVSNFSSGYNQKTGYWETSIKTNVTFIDVAAGGTVMAISEIQTSGSDKQSQNKSIQGAIDSIPMQLQYEIRKVPAFQINTRVLAASGGEIKMQLGANMGIKKGDEYAIIVGGMVEGFKDEREAGLVLVKDVGPEVSTGKVLYGNGSVAKDAQLREIPRMGADFAPYLHIVTGRKLKVFSDADQVEEDGANTMIGFRMPLSRGFYDWRPFATVQVPVNGVRTFLSAFIVPVNAIVGAEYNLYLGRLALTPYGGVGASYIYVSEAFTGVSRDTSDTYIPHIGFQGYLSASYLINRDMKVYGEVGYEYWLSLASWLYSSYGGLSVGGGVSFKL